MSIGAVACFEVIVDVVSAVVGVKAGVLAVWLLVSEMPRGGEC